MQNKYRCFTVSILSRREVIGIHGASHSGPAGPGYVLKVTSENMKLKISHKLTLCLQNTVRYNPSGFGHPMHHIFNFKKVSA